MSGGVTPPHDLRTEQALLGLCLLDADSITAASKLTPDDLYHPQHRNVWAAILDLANAGQPVDHHTVTDQLRTHGQHRGHETDVLLNELIGAAGYRGSIGRYAATIVGLATRRAAHAFARDLAEKSLDVAGDTASLVEWASDQVHGLATRTKPNRGPVTVGEALERWLQREEDFEQAGADQAALGISTGNLDLDARLLGFRPGQLVVVAARPALGKSAMGLQLAVTAAQAGHPVLFCSLEMGVDEITERILGSNSRVDLTRIRTHTLVEADWPKVTDTVAELTSAPLSILDDATATVPTIRAWAKRAPGIGMIVVDYLQLVTHTGRAANREAEVAEVARGCKRLAQELRVPVIALAQINRGVEQRADRRPTMADIRESGEIEAAADVVLGLYRDDYYDPESADRGIAEVLILKQRNGPTGTVQMAWLDHYGRFELLRRV